MTLQRVQKQSIMTSRTVGVGFGWIFSPFWVDNGGFLKAQTRGIKEGGGGGGGGGVLFVIDFRVFLKGRSPLLEWKNPKAHILKGENLKKKEIEEKEMTFHSNSFILIIFVCLFVCLFFF